MPRLAAAAAAALLAAAPALAQQGTEPPAGQQGPSKITLDDEPAWNDAEEAAAAGRYDLATDDYLKTLRTTNKTWLQTRAALRLIDVAGKAKRYDTAVAAFVALVHSDPGQAIAHRPSLPPGGDTTYVDTAFDAAEKALAEPGLKDVQKQALLSLELDLCRVRKDDARAAAILQQLNALKADPAGPDAAQRFADLKLTTAKVAMDQHQYAQAIQELTTAQAAASDLVQQEEVAYLLAEAREAQAEAAGDRGQLKDAALDYMRLVSRYDELPGNRHVADALLRTAGILERLGETKIAADLYQQVAIQYDGRPQAQSARESVRRLALSKQ